MTEKSCSGSTVRLTETISVICDRCGKSTPRNVPRWREIPVDYIHQTGRGHANCRLVVVPDPLGDDHWSYAVPEGTSTEDAIEELVRRSPKVMKRCRVSVAVMDLALEEVA